MRGVGQITNWTLGGKQYGALQDSVSVYLASAALESFEKRIPYMVDKKKSTSML